MYKIEWSKEYEMGIESVDNQHKTLVDMINCLNEPSSIQDSTRRNFEILTDVTKYAIFHFDHEEKIMFDNNFPEYEKHAELHTEFKTKILHYHALNRIDPDRFYQELSDFLKNWANDHILNEDMKIKMFLEEKELISVIP